MSLGQDILEAVKRGGIEKWSPTVRHGMPNSLRASTTKRLQYTQQQMDKCYNAIKGQMTVAQVAKESGMIPETAYKYMVRLLEDGRIVRSQSKQPHLYWRK